MVANEKVVHKLRDGGKKKKPALTKKLIQKAISGVVVDVSQNPCRRNYTNSEGMAHTLTTSTELVHLERCSAVHPRELMFLQGHNPNETRFPSRMSP